jgi:DNA recombination protein RmuC
MGTIGLTLGIVVVFAAALAVFLQRQGRQLAAMQAAAAGGQGRLVELTAELAHARAMAGAAEARAAEAASGLIESRGRADELQDEVRRLAEEKARLAAALDAERRAAAERAAEAERSREQVRQQLELVAGRLVEEKGKALLAENKVGLETFLKPLTEKLKEFEAKVEKTYDQDNRDRASLLQSLKQLQEAQARLHGDAENLARALNGESKAQGDWGELVLERILETAGLTEGREFDLQMSYTDEEGGRKRPDALVYLPGDRAVIVDSKCSLTAFLASTRAATAEERDAALAAHVASVRSHVKSLAGKNYQDVLKQRTLDIVMMFVPNEPAFQAAIAADVGLYDEAFRQRVVICSPTLLLVALQLISHIWRSEKQNNNAQKIAEEAGKLLEKLSSFVKDLDEIGARLAQAQDSFVEARGKLATGRGNVLNRANALMKLGARVRPEKVQALLPRGAAEEASEEPLLDLAAQPPPSAVNDDNTLPLLRAAAAAPKGPR